MKTMRIGSGRTMEDGKRVKILGYAPRVGKSLAELLKENASVKMIAMGDASTNTMVKAIAHAQNFLSDEGLGLMADQFTFETIELQERNGEKIRGKAMAVQVHIRNHTAIPNRKSGTPRK